METLLVIDDDAGFRDFLTTVLREEGYTVEEGDSLKQAREAVARKQFDLVLTDLRLPDGDGVLVLQHVRQISPETPVVLITAHGSVESAVEAMKLGATDYLRKPLSGPDELLLLVQRTLARHRTDNERTVLREEAEDRFAPGTFITEDPRTKEMLDMARRGAASDATILILGESGTGKEVLARYVHRHSPRAEGPFVAVNCAALSPNLIESELFGHEKGAFTGASARHIGRFERARGGALFLDEIGELELSLQAKLLRVLQEKVFERVGGNQIVSCDARLITATNCDLKERVERHAFREDLFYRIHVFPLRVPPLRERPTDVLPLARYFLSRTGRGQKLALSEEALEALRAYHWPGNVRELQNVIERAAILSDGVILPQHLPLAPATARPERTLEEAERAAVERALQESGGNRKRTAAILGISLRALQYRLKQFGLTGKNNS